MNSIDKIFSNFASKWISSSPDTVLATQNSILSIENHYGIKLPAEYTEFVKKYGNAYCPNLLDIISDRGLEFSDVQNFSLIDGIAGETTAMISTGLPEGYICFANDCMGNAFCFSIDELKGSSTPGIWFFDHDFAYIETASPSFSAWIERFANIKK